jgi:hypothetical protein
MNQQNNDDTGTIGGCRRKAEEKRCLRKPRKFDVVSTPLRQLM